ncbi:tetratricopeptide repeat protein [Saccharothrix xinjiangensis]|uniref:Tol-pal system YbgF family protein n=1 Tax=Saccharothrix xinjiangensis TaxID=204798 RepID=A0ABV9Y5P3_9PSEU
MTLEQPGTTGQPWPPEQPGVTEQPEWVDDTPTDPRLPLLTPQPPVPPPPPRWRAAAVLLNLTGIGAGYAYLGRWVRAWVATVVGVALVFTAYATDAAQSPWSWRAVAVVWLAALAVDASRLAARHPRPHGRPTRSRPVLVGALAVVVVAGAYAGYGLAGHDAYTDGTAAQSAGDCATATDEFDAVTGFYRLTLSADVAGAKRARVECADYVRAVESQRGGSHDRAVDEYLRFRQDHPDSVLRPFARDNLVETYATWARELRDDQRLGQSIEVYRDLVEEEPSFRPEAAETYLLLARAPTSTEPVARARGAVDALLVVVDEFGDTPAAAEVPGMLDAVYAEAVAPYARGEFCNALPTLEYFAGLTAEPTGKVAGDARNNLPRAVLECGLGQLRDGQSDNAVTTLERFVTTYPEHGDAAQARSALISAKVAVGTGAQLPVPAPLGASGPLRVTFYNGVNAPVSVRVAGSTAHEFTLPACAGCPASFAPGTTGDACASFAGLPGHTVGLNAGRHHVLGEYLSATDLAESFDVSGGAPYLYCTYVVQAF